MLFAFGLSFVTLLVVADEGGALVSPAPVETAFRALKRNASGKFELADTADLARVRIKQPDFWFIARSEKGEIIEAGDVPDIYRGMSGVLGRMTYSDIRDDGPPSHYLAVIRRMTNEEGTFTVFGQGTLLSQPSLILSFSRLFVAPMLVLLALVTIFGVPRIVNRAIRGISDLARETDEIDIAHRSHRLAETAVPSEVRPLVRGINSALHRLDQSYGQHQRFILDAAHELRTPVAILQARLDLLACGPERDRLVSDCERISALAEQLLDLQRLEANARPFTSVELVALCRTVAADLAPLAIDEGYDLSFEQNTEQSLIQGDAASLERAVTNLVQNAIEHAGNQGVIVVRVEPDGVIEISDDGPGIPEAERQRVFEAFYRLKPRDRGAGLGLNLVLQIAERHNGRISILTSPTGGACFRLAFGQARI
ncbi:sensor histidine kinase [Ensifer adhaerens]|uniref:sensor histidine kinase n=1 Tax=Ensifer adhaerens TaxID=106592 RepID=UPI001F409BE5|nr:HAMP domain-containing sensor histidine kinase [Ensifer adhaerens]